LIPNKGRLFKNKGKNAQWMAQAIDVPIPIASQLIFIRIRTAKIGKKSNSVAKYQQVC
jgi:hypothetical protein